MLVAIPFDTNRYELLQRDAPPEAEAGEGPDTLLRSSMSPAEAQRRNKARNVYRQS